MTPHRTGQCKLVLFWERLRTRVWNTQSLAPYAIILCVTTLLFFPGILFFITSSWDLKVLKTVFYFLYDARHSRKLNSVFVVLYSSSIRSINRRMNLNVFCNLHSDKYACWNILVMSVFKYNHMLRHSTLSTFLCKKKWRTLMLAVWIWNCLLHVLSK